MTIDQQQWAQVWELFHQALEMERDQRTPFLNRTCDTDVRLRQEVESLLSAHDRAQNLLDSPVFADSPPPGFDWSDLVRRPVNTVTYQRPMHPRRLRYAPCDIPSGMPRSRALPGEAPEPPLRHRIYGPEYLGIGDVIGPYRLQKVLGEGGMGIVYEALQEEPIRRRVALKLIKPGLETGQVLARFESERRALALMDHPHIARIYEAGSTGQGRPYFVMEMVDGITITDYCDGKGLTIRRRLELFIQVCRAVQHAHQRGIIHRDLKPSNILVTEQEGKPEPKIIDFGVAKALNQPLFDGAGTGTQNVVMIGTPEYMSPEQARRRPDIDTRTDVYSLGILLYQIMAGVSPFGDALSRCRDHLEVIELIQRHEIRRPLATLESSGGNLQRIAKNRSIDPSSLRRRLHGDLEWIILKAIDKQPQNRYQTVLELSGDVQRHLAFEPVSAGPPGVWYRSRKFLRRHRFSVAAAAALALLLTAFSAVVSIQSYRLSVALQQAQGQKERAQKISAFLIDLFRGADPYRNPGKSATLEEIVDAGAARIPAELKDQPEVQAALLATLGEVYRSLGHSNRARPLLEEALAIRRKIHGEDHPEVADSLYDLGVLLHYQGEGRQAETLLRRALELHIEHLGPTHPRVVSDLLFLGSLLRSSGRLTEAESMLRRALKVQRDSGEISSPSREMDILGQLAAVLHRQARYQDAEKTYREALDLGNSWNPKHPKTASTMANAGAMYVDWGKYNKAEPLLRNALALQLELLGPHHHSSINARTNLAYLLHQKGHYTEAESLYRKAVALSRKNLGENSSSYVINVNNLGLLLYETDRLTEAHHLFEENLRRQRQVWGESHPNVAFALTNLGRVLRAMHRYADAERFFRQGLELRRQTLPPEHPALSGSLTSLGALRLERGEPVEAEEMLREALQIRQRSYSAEDWRTAQTENLLGAALAAQERYREAEPMLINGFNTLQRLRGPRRRETRQAMQRVLDFFRRSSQLERASELKQMEVR